MKCPICKVALNANKLDGNLPGLSCPQCGGNFIRCEMYQSWLNAQGGRLPEKDISAQASLPVEDSKPGKLCPQCGAFLIRFNVGHDVPFAIDHCGHCGGIWLDKNEWEILKSRNLHDEIHLVFSQSWQAQVKQQAQKQQYAEVVTKILDDKLLNTVSQDDLSKIKDFKTWLDANPNKNDLYAYLLSTKQLAE